MPQSRRIAQICIAVVIAIAVNLTIADPLLAAGGKAQKKKAKIEKQAATVAAQTRAAEYARDVAKLESSAQQARETEALDKFSAAKSRLEDAKSHSKLNSDERRELETKIETAAGTDSPVAQAKHAFETAKQEFEQAQERALADPSYVAKKTAAEKSNASAVEIAKLRDEALADNRDYRLAETKFNETRTKYRQLRLELFSRDPDWTANVAAAREAQREEVAAQAEARGHASRKIDAGSRRREAEGIADGASQNIHQGQATLMQLQEKYQRYGGKTLPIFKKQKPLTSAERAQLEQLILLQQQAQEQQLQEQQKKQKHQPPAKKP
jgi:hypothetical protein